MAKFLSFLLNESGYERLVVVHRSFLRGASTSLYRRLQFLLSKEIERAAPHVGGRSAIAFELLSVLLQLWCN
jgi:hypothetical protein